MVSASEGMFEASSVRTCLRWLLDRTQNGEGSRLHKGDLAVGVTVRVKGVFVSGTLHAGEIKARDRDEDDEVDDSDEDEHSIKIEGTVDALIADADGNITGVVVNSVEVSIDALTEIEGALKVGDEVKIKGTVRDGVLVATKVELEEPNDDDDGDRKRGGRVEIEGVIEEVGRDADGNVVSITVDGREVAIEPRTDVRGTIAVGADVEIDAVLTRDGLVARKLRGDKDKGDAEQEDEDGDRQDNEADEDDGGGAGDSSGSGPGG